MAEERMTIAALIDTLKDVAAAHGSFGDMLPVVIEAPDGPRRYKIWLDLEVREIYLADTGERLPKGGEVMYRALVIRGAYD